MQCTFCTVHLFYHISVSVWNKTYMSDIKPLFISQNRAVRIKHNDDSREQVFIKSGLMKLKDGVELQTF